MKLCSATEEMIKTGMKELDVDGVSAQLQQSLYSASDMLGEFTKTKNSLTGQKSTNSAKSSTVS